MGLDVPVLGPPSLHGPRSRDDAGTDPEDTEDDSRREELADGAWADALDE
jgi:hypothetical protein